MDVSAVVLATGAQSLYNVVGRNVAEAFRQIDFGDFLIVEAERFPAFYTVEMWMGVVVMVMTVA